MDMDLVRSKVLTEISCIKTADTLERIEFLAGFVCGLADAARNEETREECDALLRTMYAAREARKNELLK